MVSQLEISHHVRRRMTREEMKARAQRKIEQNSPIGTKVLICPLGRQKAVFTAQLLRNGVYSPWHLLHKATSYKALLAWTEKKWHSFEDVVQPKKKKGC